MPIHVSAAAAAEEEEEEGGGGGGKNGIRFGEETSRKSLLPPFIWHTDFQFDSPKSAAWPFVFSLPPTKAQHRSATQLQQLIFSLVPFLCEGNSKLLPVDLAGGRDGQSHATRKMRRHVRPPPPSSSCDM